MLRMHRHHHRGKTGKRENGKTTDCIKVLTIGTYEGTIVLFAYAKKKTRRGGRKEGREEKNLSTTPGKSPRPMYRLLRRLDRRYRPYRPIYCPLPPPLHSHPSSTPNLRPPSLFQPCKTKKQKGGQDTGLEFHTVTRIRNRYCCTINTINTNTTTVRVRDTILVSQSNKTKRKTLKKKYADKKKNKYGTYY